MNRVVVAGIVNVESNLQVDTFPVPYRATKFAPIPVNVSGVGFNVAAGLAALGTPVTLLSFLGDDVLGVAAEQALRDRMLWGPGIVRFQGDTPRSVVLHDHEGRRRVFTDLAGVPDRTYPGELLPQLLENAACAILTNVGFTRPLLRTVRDRGLAVACDVHALSDLRDPYNREYMAHSDVLFMSDERLPLAPPEWLDALMMEYTACQVAVVGMGAAGCCIKVRGDAARMVAALTPRPVVNSAGAGDALFASFMHYSVEGVPPLDAIELAVAFAGWKIGESGGAQGFPSPSHVEALVHSLHRMSAQLEMG